MGAISSIKKLGGGGAGDYKSKIAAAIKDIEIQRKELENLKVRLSERRQKLFESTVRSVQEKNNPKANVYATEHAEVRKTMRVVETSELALMQVSLRLQSIMEVGDAMAHLTTAFKSLREVSKTMGDYVPALDETSATINNTLTETMAQMGQLSPTIHVDIHNENADELVEQAKKFAEEQSEKLKQSLHTMPRRFETEVSQPEDRIPILATGEDDEDENVILGMIFAKDADPRVEDEVLKYATAHKGVIDVSETSVNLGIPQDAVEQTMIRLVAQGKVKSQRSDA